MTAVCPTHGTSTVETDANPATATLNTPTVHPVTCCLVSVIARPVLEAGLAMNVETYSGAILRSNATHVTVTQEALPPNSVIRCLVSACARRVRPGEGATPVGVATWGPFPSVSRVMSVSVIGIEMWERWPIKHRGFWRQ